MRTFEYGQFKGTFLQTHFSEKALPMSWVHWDWTGVHIFKTEGEEKLLKHMAMETNFLEPFYQAKLILYLWWYVFFCELPGENGREYRKLVFISNNYTEVSDENGTIFFFFYDLNGSMYKNEPTM